MRRIDPNVSRMSLEFYMGAAQMARKDATTALSRHQQSCAGAAKKLIEAAFFLGHAAFMVGPRPDVRREEARLNAVVAAVRRNCRFGRGA